MTALNNQLKDDKIKAFQLAMDKYHQYGYYNQLHIITAFIIISMQGFALYALFNQSHSTALNAVTSLPILMCAYLMTDFINGLIHMYMDNNTHYESLFGPFIAAFHLHHKQIIYKKRNPIIIYYLETGYKFWLIAYLIILLYLQYYHYLSAPFNLLLVAIGILSSVAELSHYWCHNSTSDHYLIRILQKYYVLLPKKHHLQHHIQDNKNYAFLNGLSDPIINRIAHYFYKGYKNHADQHVFSYFISKKNC